MACATSPFACTEASENVQNLGCLPTPAEITEIKQDTGRNWSCHGNERRICAGYVEAAKVLGLDYKQGPAASYTRWYHEGRA